MIRIAAVGMAVTAALSLAACEDPEVPTPAAAELALVTKKIDAEMNSPISAVRQRMTVANRDGKMYADDMVISGAGGALPVDWWIYDQGLMKVAGRAEYYVYFSLTPDGEAFAKATTPWLVSRFQAPPTINCAGSKSWASCKITGVAVVQAAPGLETALKGGPIAAQPFSVDLEYGPQGWRVGELALTSGEKSFTLAQKALFGDPEQVYAARDAFANKAGRDARRL